MRRAFIISLHLLTFSLLHLQVRMFADAMTAHSRKPMVGLSPDSLFDHYRHEKPTDAWTHEAEFH